MKTISINRKKTLIVAICLLSIAVLVADARWLPYHGQIKQYDHTFTERTRTRYSRSSYTSDFIQTTDGQTYLSPMRLDNYLVPGDTICIMRSALFNKPSVIAWCKAGSCYEVGISIFHNGDGWLMFIAALVVLGVFGIAGIYIGQMKGAWIFYLFVTGTVCLCVFYLVMSHN